jgi:hypothetical protein
VHQNRLPMPEPTDFNGTVFESITAFAQRRDRAELYHAALVVTTTGSRFVVEMTPIPDARAADRGVVLEGPVGARWAARLRIFRYEIRRWANGVILDIQFAVASPVRVSDDASCARRLLDLVPEVPPMVWGRDEVHAHDMWNSNSVVSWLLTSSGVDVAHIQPPPGGRAPGWKSGLGARARGAPDRQWRGAAITSVLRAERDSAPDVVVGPMTYARLWYPTPMPAARACRGA